MNSLLIEEESKSTDYNNGKMQKEFSEVLSEKSLKKNQSYHSKRNTLTGGSNNFMGKISKILSIKNNEKDAENLRNSMDEFNKDKINRYFEKMDVQRSQSTIIQTELIEMGFELNLINKIIKFYEIKSIEQAIEYLTKTNDKWNHPFMYLEIDDNQSGNNMQQNINLSNNNLTANLIIKKNNEIKCLICDENADKHLDYCKYKNPSVNLNSSIQKIDIFSSLDSNKMNRVDLNKSLDLNFNFKKNHSENLQKKTYSILYSNGENGFENSSKMNENTKENCSIDDLNKEDNIFGEDEIKFVDNKKEEKFCDICMCDSVDYFTLECNHVFCNECLSLYLINKFNNSEVEEILCPNSLNCKIIITPEIIKKLVVEESFKRYERFLFRNKILKNPTKFVLCPIPNCESYAEYSDELIEEIKNHKKSEKITDIKKLLDDSTSEIEIDKNELINKLKIANIILVCKDENHAFCNFCKKYAHGQNDCGINLQEEYQKILKNTKHIRKCPKCCFYIEKNQGCNHMKCYNKECLFEFCWICMGTYNSNHYDNPLTPCFGLQYLNQDNIIVKCPCLIYLKWFLVFILFIICIPLSIALVPFAPFPSLYISLVAENYYYFQSSSTKSFFHFLGFLSYFLLGIGLLPISILLVGIGLVSLFFFALYSLIRFMCK